MLDYTKAAVKKTVDDFKRLDYVRNLVTQVLYIFYLIYALIAGAGNVWANAALLLLSLAYFVFFLIVTTGRILKAKSKTQKIVSTVFTRCKQLIKLFTLGVMLYGIYATTTHVTALSVILSALLIVGWILQIVFEVVLKFFVNRAQFIIEGIEADYEQLKKPVTTVGNFFKRLTGKEIEPEKEKSKARIWLDKKVEENKAARIEKKRAEKERKKQAKIDAKNTQFLPPISEPTAQDLVEPTPIEVFEEPPLLPETEETNEKKRKKRKREK